MYSGSSRRRLPFVNPSLARAIKILSPAGSLGPVDIVAELAALDGLRDHTKALLALDQVRIRGLANRNTGADGIQHCKSLYRCIFHGGIKYT